MDLPACIENANDLHGLFVGDPRLITFPVDRRIHNENINHCPTWYTKTAKLFHMTNKRPVTRCAHSISSVSFFCNRARFWAFSSSL